MAKGLLRLNEEELRFLENRIGNIEIQKGCPVQCITCGADAEKYSANMPWKDFMKISDSILEVKVKKNIRLLEKKYELKKKQKVVLFGASDPMYYRSLDGDKERTLWDAVRVITEDHNAFTYITTSGWQSNNYMQRAAEKIARSRSKNIGMMYSIKTVSKKTINEYKQIRARFNTSKEALNEFIQNSNYTKRLIENMNTLKRLNISYSQQYLDYHWIYGLNKGIQKFIDIRLPGTPKTITLPEEYESIKELFTQETIEAITKQAYSHIQPNEQEQKIFLAKCEDRLLGGFGKARELGFYSSDNIIPRLNITPEKERRRHRLKDEELVAGIKANGTLQIYLGPEELITKKIIPKAYFEARAEYYKKEDIKQHNFFNMLANLQGKQLLE